MTLRDQFLTLARLYAQAEGIGLAALSSRVFNDSKKIPALAAGRDFTTARYEAGVRYIAARWPADIAWPDGVHRPAPLPEESAA